jgi:hypothetical protein
MLKDLGVDLHNINFNFSSSTNLDKHNTHNDDKNKL